MSPDFVTLSNLIIDDIVLSDGRSFMNTLGGAGTHALIGMRVWSDRLGFVATIGADFDLHHRQRLESLGIDLRGLIERMGYRTARAWQLFEPDERRIEVFRTSSDDFDRYRPQLSDIPKDYFAAKGCHLELGTLAELVAVADSLHAANPAMYLVWEPSPSQLTAAQDELQAALSRLDLFSPDLGEARTLTGESSVESMIAKLLSWGAPRVALRMGAAGSMVGTAAGELYRVPAIPTTIVDVTGAGNAYCGGFLVGLGSGLAVVEAAARAAVSASFALEQFGVPAFGPDKQQEAERRLTWVRERIERLSGTASPARTGADLVVPETGGVVTAPTPNRLAT